MRVLKLVMMLSLGAIVSAYASVDKTTRNARFEPEPPGLSKFCLRQLLAKLMSWFQKHSKYLSRIAIFQVAILSGVETPRATDMSRLKQFLTRP